MHRGGAAEARYFERPAHGTTGAEYELQSISHHVFLLRDDRKRSGIADVAIDEVDNDSVGYSGGSDDRFLQTFNVEKIEFRTYRNDGETFLNSSDVERI